MISSVRITDLPQNERPRERLFRYGPSSISNAELLAIILGTGFKGENVLELCNIILNEIGGLNKLFHASKDELTSLNGIKNAKAAKIIALGELAKRFETFSSGDDYRITCPKDAANLMMKEMMVLKKEVLKLIMVNTKNVVIAVKTVSIGSLNSSIVHPREIFKEAIRESSASIIICHNHPSGDPSPSNEDINITSRLKECGNILGIELLDHIIIGNMKYVSLKEKNLL